MDKANKSMHACRQTDAHYTSIDIKIYIKKTMNFYFVHFDPPPNPPNGKVYDLQAAIFVNLQVHIKLQLLLLTFLKVRFNMVYMY